jgi:very-short-patch-repair endonuclease
MNMGDYFFFRRELRKNQTDVEKDCGDICGSRRFEGLKFRRQEQIGQYIVDFVCFKKKLIIELDGSQHIDNNEQDNIRDNWLKSQGFTILRFWNNEVIKNIEGVLTVIQNNC